MSLLSHGAEDILDEPPGICRNLGCGMREVRNLLGGIVERLCELGVCGVHVLKQPHILKTIDCARNDPMVKHTGLKAGFHNPANRRNTAGISEDKARVNIVEEEVEELCGLRRVSRCVRD